jgi:elongin-A
MLLGLQDVGDFEYLQIRTVLARVSSAEQLHEIEVNSPQIKGEDAELWKAFIARDIPDWKRKNYVPKNPEKWYEVYMKYKKEQSREIEADKEKLKEAMMGLKKDKESHVSQKIDPRFAPRLPRDSKMKAIDGVPISGRRKGFAKVAPSALTWSAGSKTKMTTGAGVLSRARREAKELSARNKLIKPTNTLVAQKVVRAPKGMVNEYRKAEQPIIRIMAPKRKPNSDSISSSSLEERERRLRALTMPNRDEPGMGRVTVVDSDSDDKNDYSDDGIFDERLSAPLPTLGRNQATQISKSRSFPFQTPSRVQSRPISGSQPAPPSLPKHESKPSDIISSLISKAGPKHTTPFPASSSQSQSNSPSRARETESTSVRRSGSPIRPVRSILNPSPTRKPSPMRTASPIPGQPRPMAPKRKVEVDIFNRGSRKVRR